MCFFLLLSQVLQYTHADVFREVMFPLFERIAECIQSPHFLVAERALFLWNNENFVRFLNLNKEVRGRDPLRSSRWRLPV